MSAEEKIEVLEKLKSKFMKEADKLEHDSEFTDDSAWEAHLTSMAQGLREAANITEKLISEVKKPAVKTAGLRAPALATQVLTSLSQGGHPPSGYVTGGYSPRGASPAPGSEGRSTPAGEVRKDDTPPADIGEGTLSAPREQTPDGRAGLSPAHSPREAEKERGGERANSSHRQDGVSPSPMYYERT